MAGARAWCRGDNLCEGRCHNGGTCQVKDGRPSCSCLAGYTGTECETELGACANSPCLHGGECQETDSKAFRCQCPSGFRGHRCEILVDLCSANPCPEGTSCLGGEGSYLCSCPEGAVCQALQEPCIEGMCQGAMSATILYAVLPLVLLLVLAVPISVILALWLHRKSRQTPPVVPEPVSNNSLQPDAVHLIRNITHPGDAEQGLREEGVGAKSGLPPALRPLSGLPKTDISNEERAKLNRLNTGPDLQRPLH